MNYFNNFQEALDKSPSISSMVILAFRGNAKEWSTTHHYKFHSVHGQMRNVPIGSFKERNDESMKATRANVMYYNPDTGAVATNTLYRNTKGLYFKTGMKKFYIIEEPIPEEML